MAGQLEDETKRGWKKCATMAVHSQTRRLRAGEIVDEGAAKKCYQIRQLVVFSDMLSKYIIVQRIEESALS